MKNRFETTPDDSPLSKRASFSNSYASRYYPASDQKPKRSLSRENSQTFAYASNSRLETSFQQNTDPSPLERGSRASLSPHKGIVHWGVSSSEDVYQTTYKNCYETHDKINAAPKKRDPHIYPRQLSGSLIPHNVTETKRIQKDGDHNYSASRRLPTEDDTFFDRIGERKQPSPDRGRAHLTEPRVEDPALRTQHRFYRPVEQTHGESSRNMSASRLIKQVLDFCPPQSIVPGGGFVTRNIESLAFSGDVDHPDTVHTNKIGSGYSRVEKKIKEEAFRGKKQYNKSMSENEMKTILAHKDLYKKDFVPIETTKMLKSMKASKPKPEGNSYQSIHFKRTMTSLGLTQQKVDRSLSNVRLETEPVQRKGSLTAYESGREREGSVKKEATITFDPRRWSVNENKQLMTPSKDPNMNTFLKSISKTAGKSPTRDRSRSGSVKSLRGDASRKSVGGFDVAEREKSQDKNSFIVVSHEKKKPTRGGTFKNPILSNNSGKKTLRACTETFTAFKKNNILNY